MSSEVRKMGELEVGVEEREKRRTRDGGNWMKIGNSGRGARYAEVAVVPEAAERARSLGPIFETEVFGRRIFLFEGQPAERLDGLGERRVPGIADLFVAKMKGVKGVSA